MLSTNNNIINIDMIHLEVITPSLKISHINLEFTFHL